jgi:uncharacterized repeat protein (TIGR03803 family)
MFKEKTMNPFVHRNFSQHVSRGIVAVLAVTLFATLAATRPALAQTETVLYNFCSHPKCIDGGLPIGSLARDSKGNLYGATEEGGVDNFGIVFKLTAQGKETVLHTFTGGSDGEMPSGGVVMDSSGNLYGATALGGAYLDGTVFKVSLTGTETTLYTFGTSSGDGKNPIGGVILDSAGNVYGVTVEGGAYGNGSVYKVSPDGAETILHSFGGPYGSSVDGYLPQAGLIMDNNGNLYGTTGYGGDNDDGVVFEYSASGEYTILANFEPNNGPALPYASLTLSSSGVLYGTTYAGGTSIVGTVFSLTPSSGGVWTVDTLYSFSTTVGDEPLSGVLAKDGIFYGTTFRKGEGGFGSVFELTADGTFTTLVNFSGTTTGSAPAGNLLMDSAGNLYGVGFEGGTNDSGVVYKVIP